MRMRILEGFTCCDERAVASTKISSGLGKWFSVENACYTSNRMGVWNRRPPINTRWPTCNSSLGRHTQGDGGAPEQEQTGSWEHPYQWALGLIGRSCHKEKKWKSNWGRFLTSTLGLHTQVHLCPRMYAHPPHTNRRRRGEGKGMRTWRYLVPARLLWEEQQFPWEIQPTANSYLAT